MGGRENRRGVNVHEMIDRQVVRHCQRGPLLRQRLACTANQHAPANMLPRLTGQGGSESRLRADELNKRRCVPT